MKRISSLSPANLKVFTSFLLSFLLFVSPLATLADSMKSAAATSAAPSAAAKSQPDLAQGKALKPRSETQSGTQHTSPTGFFNLFAPVAGITTTMRDTLTDSNGNGLADKGEIISYDAVITNTTGGTLSGVNFTDTSDANTTFTGSVSLSPIAQNDSYQTIGNVNIQVPVAQGVIQNNDLNPNPTGTLTVTKVNSTNVPSGGSASASTGSGSVTMNSDGSFTYNPNAGFRGPTDSFTYTLGNGTGMTDTATVTINVSGIVWFINNGAGAGDGRLSAPFNSLAAFQAINDGGIGHPAANDNIFLYESGVAYTGPVTLLSGQKLIGQDATATLLSITGLSTPSGSALLPATNSGNATIVKLTSAGNAINLTSGSAGNTIRGLTVGSTTATGISGTNFGTLSVSDTDLSDSPNRTGQALNLSAGILAATFTSINSVNSSTTGITLNEVAGSMSSGSTTVTTPAGAGINVTDTNTGNANPSSVTLNFNNTTSVTNSGGTAVNLTSNTGTISFATLNITNTTSNQPGLNASDNTNTVTTTGGTINTGSGTAVNISKTSGTSPLNITLTSVSSNGGTNDGISIKNTTGSFTVNGDGSNTSVGGNSTGGTIANKSGSDGSTTAGIGVYLENVQNITLRRVKINGVNQNFGIRGFSVNNFTLEYSTVGSPTPTNAGTIAANLQGTSVSGIGEGAIYFGSQTDGVLGLTGTGTFTSNFISAGRYDNMQVSNGGGSLNRLNITGSTFGYNFVGTPQANAALTVVARRATSGSSTVNSTVTGNTFVGSPGNAANFTGVEPTTTLSVAMDTIFQNNTITNNHANNNIGGCNLTIAGFSSTTFNASNNTMTGANGSAITLQMGAPVAGSTVATSFSGTLNNNTIGTAGVQNSGSATGNGIFLSLADNATAPKGQATIAITNNQIHGYHGNFGISADNTASTGGAYNVDLTITGNTTGTPSPSTSFGGLGLTAGAPPPSNNDIDVCAVVTGNDFSNGDPANSNDIIAGGGANGASTLRLPGLSNTTLAGAAAFLKANNLNSATTIVNTYSDIPGGASPFAGGAACTSPSASYEPNNTYQRDHLARTDNFFQGNDADSLFALLNIRSDLFAGAHKGISQKSATSEQEQTESVYVNRTNSAERHAVVVKTSYQPAANRTGGGIYWTSMPAGDTRLSHAKGRSFSSNHGVRIRATKNAALMPVGGNVAATIPMLPNNKSVTVRFTVTVNDPLTGTSNKVSTQGTFSGSFGSSQTDDPDTAASNDATETPLARTDLALTSITDSVTTTTPGSTLTYTLSYSNPGRAATGVVLTETVPAGTTFNAGASSAGWACTPDNHAGSTCTLTIGSLNHNAAATKNFAVTVNNPVEAALNTISNTASIADDGSYEPDINAANDTATDTDTLNAAPAFTLTKADGVTTTTPGSTLTYTLSYSNTGNQGATGVFLTETVPAGTAFNAGASSAGWTETPSGSGSYKLSVGSLAGAGSGSGTAMFVVTVSSPAAAGVGSIVNQASMTDDGSNSPSAITANASDTDTLEAAPDLALSKTPDVTNAGPGQTITYTLSYSNTGSQGAAGVVITETVPANTTYAAAATPGWACTPDHHAGSTCTKTVGALAGGGATGSTTFAVTVADPLPGGATQLTNVATIDDDHANGTDPNTANNSTGNVTTPLDTPPTLGNYSNTTLFVTQGTTVSPSAAPADDHTNLTLAVSASPNTYAGTLSVDQTTGVVTIGSAAPADTYTVTVTASDSAGQQTSKSFQLTVSKSGTTTTLASNKNPSFNNQSVTFTATVTSTTAVTGPPTGTVDFFDGATLLCDDAAVDGTGQATCSTSSLSVAGSPHSITATYQGDAVFDTSTSAPLMQTISPSLALVVNTTSEAADANVGDGVCDTDTGTAGDQCTLRAAIQETNSVPSDDAITFNIPTTDPGYDSGSGVYSITLSTALDNLDGDLTITGLGAKVLTVGRDAASATPEFRIFTISPGRTVTLSGLTISGGKATGTGSSAGGGILNDHSTLTLSGMAVSGNRAAFGGGLYNNGRDSGSAELTILNSTLSGNTAEEEGGAVYNSGENGGGATLSIANSTFSGNNAKSDGGGIASSGLGNNAVTLTNATVTNNHSDADDNGDGEGGGLWVSGGSSKLRNTIVAGNFKGSGDIAPSDLFGALDTSLHNLIGAGGSGGLVHGVNNNQVGVADARLAALADNGGATRTHALLAGSPALDAGDNTLAANAGLSNDQRGPAFNRFVDATDAGTVATTDLGAFEAQVSVEDISNKGTAEDVALAAFNFEVAADPGVTGLSVTATSSDQTIVPNANLVLGGAGTTRSLAITPAANKFGTTTITVTVSGLQAGVLPVSMSDTFDFVVTPVADTPEVADITTTEDTQSGPILVSRNPVDGAEVTHFRVSAITGGTLYLPNGTTQLTGGDFVSFADGAAGLRFTPLPNYTGPGHFTVQAATGNLPAALGTGTDTATITVTAVNDQPTLGPVNNRFILEDSAGEVITLTGIGAGGNETQTLSVTATSSNPAIVPHPVITYTSPNSSATLTYAPAANANGTVSITVTVSDGGGGSETVSRTFSINITAVNDAPFFTKGANQSVGEDAGPQSIGNWATSISAGAPNESSQVLTFVVSNNNPGLFSQQPALSPAGTLTYTAKANTAGTATVTVILKDGSGTANSGQDMSSPPQSFNLTVTAVNDAPVNAVPATAQSVVKNGMLVFDAAHSNLVSISDVDAGAGVVKVALTAQKGTVTLASTTGLSFSTGDGTSDQYLIFTGTLSNINAALNAMQFKPTANYVGAASLTILSNDQGNSPGPARTDSDTISINVTNAVAAGPSSFSLAAPVYSTAQGYLRAALTIKRRVGP